MPIRILHAHNYGHKNIGDDAMAENVFSKLSKIANSEVITISTYAPPQRGGNDIRSLSGMINNYKSFSLKVFLVGVHRLKLKPIYTVYSWLCCELSFLLALIYKRTHLLLLPPSHCRTLIKTIAHADYYVRSGSGSLNDIWFWSSMYPQYTEARLCKLFGVKVFFTGQGIGPLSTAYRVKTLKKFAECCTRITYRDVTESEQLVNSTRPAHLSHESVGDDAFDYPKASLPDSIAHLLAGKKALVCQFRPTNYEAELSDVYWQSVASALERFVDQTDSHAVVLVSFSNGRVNDLEIARKINAYAHDKLIVLDNVFTPGEAKALLAKAFAAIGQSYHFAVFALAEDVPTIALYTNQYYKQKHEGLLAWYQMEKYAIAESNVNSLEQAINELTGEHEQLKEKLKAVNSTMTEHINKVFNEIMGLS